ncbi:MAG: twin-arginine translocation signal domain-containing protein [Dehalococcoidia bacterium]
MEQRFDALSKRLAAGVTRREALKRAGVGGVAGVLLGGVGLGRARSSEAARKTGGPPSGGTRQDQEKPESALLTPFELSVTSGPRAGQEMDGFLALSVDGSGTITNGAFVLMDGTRLGVSGQANGRSISLLFDRGDGSFIYGVGVTQNDLSQGGGTMGGLFVDSLDNSTGNWAVLTTVGMPIALGPAPAVGVIRPRPTPSPRPSPGPGPGPGFPGGGGGCRSACEDSCKEINSGSADICASQCAKFACGQ